MNNGLKNKIAEANDQTRYAQASRNIMFLTLLESARMLAKAGVEEERIAHLFENIVDKDPSYYGQWHSACFGIYSEIREGTYMLYKAEGKRKEQREMKAMIHYDCNGNHIGTTKTYGDKPLSYMMKRRISTKEFKFDIDKLPFAVCMSDLFVPKQIDQMQFAICKEEARDILRKQKQEEKEQVKQQKVKSPKQPKQKVEKKNKNSMSGASSIQDSPVYEYDEDQPIQLIIDNRKTGLLPIQDSPRNQEIEETTNPEGETTSEDFDDSLSSHDSSVSGISDCDFGVAPQEIVEEPLIEDSPDEEEDEEDINVNIVEVDGKKWLLDEYHNVYDFETQDKVEGKKIILLSTKTGKIVSEEVYYSYCRRAGYRLPLMISFDDTNRDDKDFLASIDEEIAVMQRETELDEILYDL